MKGEGRGNGTRGFSLPEVLVASAILGMMSVVGVGVLGRICEQSSTRALTQIIRSLVVEATTRAVIQRAYVGIVFQEGAAGANARLFIDGDGDGVLHEDIARGADSPLGSAVFLKEGWAYLGLPDAVKTDPSGRALGSRDPIRFGRASVLSFSPQGTSTPGSLYLRDLRGHEAWCFRVAGIDGRIRVYRWWKGEWSEER